ncbi:MAG: GNAT family N-acetyltransferase [Catenulispora sp.]|nr:GNAT family N-acetyltransferase [Catenulispora sp.]
MTSNCLFEDAWWLDLTAPGSWAAAEVPGADGLPAARWPYMVTTVAGMTAVCMPELTQTLGPWLTSPSGKPSNALGAEHRALDSLLDQLPEHDFFLQSFHHSRWNWLPMHWRGFKATARVTYVFDEVPQPDQIWSGMVQRLRTSIRKAESALRVRTGTVEEFLRLHLTTFERQSMELPWSVATVRDVVTGAVAQGHGRVLVAEDEEGIARTASVAVWDSRTMYSVLAGSDDVGRQRRGMPLVIWQSVRLAAELGIAYDFEGTMLPQVEWLPRALGASQRPYLQLWRSNGGIEAHALPGELPPETFLRLRSAETNRVTS